MKNRFHVGEGSGKIMIALALLVLLALPLRSLLPRHLARAAAQQQAHLQGKDLKSRAFAICTALGTVDPTISEPRFVVQDFHFENSRDQRRMWVVACLAGSHRYQIIFNDLTGNVESMYADGMTDPTQAVGRREVAVTSPSEAVEGSVQRLKDLQMVPKGTRITLAERPQCDRDGILWRLVWKVRRSEAAPPYEVRMVLNGTDATPLSVVNCKELEKYALN